MLILNFTWKIITTTSKIINQESLMAIVNNIVHIYIKELKKYKYGLNLKILIT